MPSGHRSVGTHSKRLSAFFGESRQSVFSNKTWNWVGTGLNQVNSWATFWTGPVKHDFVGPSRAFCNSRSAIYARVRFSTFCITLRFFIHTSWLSRQVNGSRSIAQSRSTCSIYEASARLPDDWYPQQAERIVHDRADTPDNIDRCKKSGESSGMQLYLSGED